MEQKELETIATEICDTYDIFAPPVPVEIMLQKPRDNMWEELDPSQLSGSFMSIRDRYSPRMSLARMLVRHIAASDWGQERNLHTILGDTQLLNMFARMLLMPKDMVLGLTSSARNPKTMSIHFEVPQDDARERLLELL
ncbi:MAG: hypothetical protein Q9P44_10530 [Anaerolineae bacterium]|nr:hypothetical protein [Anaerolineae bacterium]